MTNTKQIRFVLLLMLVGGAVCHASSLFDAAGNVAGSPIEMRLNLSDAGQIDGFYAYTRIGKPINLTGHIDGDRIQLTTLDAPIQEHFDGKILRLDGDVIRIWGRWHQEGKDRTHSFAVSNQPDPYDDNHISCEEMASNPAMVFREDVDLGSGFGSPNDVDFGCPKSLANLGFLKPLLDLAYNIREASWSVGGCTGTMRYAAGRHYSLELARLGYFPQSRPHNPGQSRGEKYFEEWGFQSLYNRAIYLDYLKLRNSARPQLADWYAENASIDYDTASKYADKALITISNWAFGGHSSQWEPEPLVPYTESVLQGDQSAFVEALGSASKAQKLNSLRRLLASKPEISLVRAVLVNTPDVLQTGRSESPLSLAVKEPAILALMLQSGFDPNHQNEFGKTPLYYAIDFNQPKAVQLLLDSGANVNHGYQEGDPNDVTWRWGCTSIEHWQRTPLMHAAQHADIAMLKLLLEAGADINSRDSLGKTAVDYAKDNDRPENMAFLLGLK